MITTIESYTDTSIPFAELCIIGTGAAGLELATQLESSFTSILLLEGGMESFDWRTQNLSYFKQTGRPIRTPARSQPFDFELAKTQQAHLRQFGGTLNIWGGKWKALDPFDLLPKPYLQESSWPISYDELHAYYQAVAKDYDIEDLLWLHDNPSELPSTITSLPCFNPSIDLLEQTPANSKDKFQERLKNSSVIKLILGANVVNIFLSDSLNHVQHLIVRSLSGHEWHVQAKQFILACGTIENTRLLLSSHTQLKKGIGNESDWVGRNLLDHPKGRVGLLFPYDQKDIIET